MARRRRAAGGSLAIAGIFSRLGWLQCSSKLGFEYASLLRVRGRPMRWQVAVRVGCGLGANWLWRWGSCPVTREGFARLCAVASRDCRVIAGLPAPLWHQVDDEAAREADRPQNYEIPG
jgi:hypothetical protein